MNEEVKKELEQATEIDLERLYDALAKPIEALQKLISAELESLSSQGVDTNGFYLSVEPMEFTIHIGDYSLLHEIRHNIYKVR